MFSACQKTKLFAKSFSENSNLDDSGISLPAFPFRSNLKLHNIHVTPKLVKKVMTSLDSLKVSSPDCISVLLLEKCQPELSHMHTSGTLQYVFEDCWKVLSLFPVFKNVGERYAARNYLIASLLSIGSKVFEKLVDNRLVDQFEKSVLFLISSMVSGLLDQLQIF